MLKCTLIIYKGWSTGSPPGTKAVHQSVWFKSSFKVMYPSKVQWLKCFQYPSHIMSQLGNIRKDLSSHPNFSSSFWSSRRSYIRQLPHTLPILPTIWFNLLVVSLDDALIRQSILHQSYWSNVLVKSINRKNTEPTYRYHWTLTLRYWESAPAECPKLCCSPPGPSGPCCARMDPGALVSEMCKVTLYSKR